MADPVVSPGLSTDENAFMDMLRGAADALVKLPGLLAFYKNRGINITDDKLQSPLTKNSAWAWAKAAQVTAFVAFLQASSDETPAPVDALIEAFATPPKP